MNLESGKRPAGRLCAIVIIVMACVMTGMRSLRASSASPASFGVDIPQFTHLGFAGRDETIKFFGQASMLPGLSGNQMTFGASGVWSYKMKTSRLLELGAFGSKTSGNGRVLFDGLPPGPSNKLKYDTTIGRAGIQTSLQLTLNYESLEGSDAIMLEILSLVATVGWQDIRVDFPEVSTTVNGDGPIFGLGLLWEKDYIPGWVLHASGMLVYSQMTFDSLFDKGNVNNDPVELQARTGMELYLSNGWNISMDIIGAFGEANNFGRYGVEFGVRYNY